MTLVVARADLYLQRVCVGWYPSCFRNTPGQRRHSFSRWSTLGELGAPLNIHVWLTDLGLTVETDSRAWPALELGVDSPGATRSCVSLVRGTLTFQSFRHLPSQVETGRTCKAYDGLLVHPCRVKSFRKAVSTVMDDLRPTPCS